MTAELKAAHADALHVAAVKIANAIEDRDTAIRQAYADGMSAREIADAVGLSRQRIWQIAGDLSAFPRGPR